MKKIRNNITILGIIIFILSGYIFISFPILAQDDQFSLLKNNTQNFIGNKDEKLNIPNFLYGTPLFKDETSQDEKGIIDGFIKKYSNLFQINFNDFKTKIEKPVDRNITLVHLYQQYKNIPVFGSEMIFTINQNNELIGYIGKYIPDINIDTNSKLTPLEIKNIATQDLKVNDIKEESKLLIFNEGILTNTKEETKLAWRLGSHGWVYFIDANSGEIIYKYNDENYALDREIYTASGGTPTLPGTLIISEGDDTSTITDDDALDAYTYSAYVYNYFYNNFSLDSYDNTGSPMVTTTDYALSPPNSGWCNPDKPTHSGCPTTPQTLFSDNYTVLDVVAHEWAHAVDDYAVRDESAGLYGLTYSDESGALNESYSDIFGALIENEYSELDWNFGEDLPSGTIRSLQDPTLYSQPDTYSNYISGGDPHANSGIPNKAAYLIMREKSDGYETFNSIDVRGMGIEKAENIFYYTLRDQLLTSSDIEDNFNALFLTCLTLDTIELDNLDCESVYDAYTAIEVADGTIIYENAAISVDIESGYTPLTVNFDGSDSVSYGRNITDYSWDFGDGSTDSGMTAAHTYVSTGTHTATLTITDGDGQIASTTQEITVNNPITPTFTISGDGVAAPATVSFDASATTDATGMITDYSWDFGDGTTTSTGTTATTTHTYTTSGYYDVTLTVADSSGYTNTYADEAYIMGPTYKSGAIHDETWTADLSPYIISSTTTVASGYTLTIEPGTIIKFYDINSNLLIYGTLDAQGTATNQIIFTSLKDDAYGGDTNGDGSTTSPTAGDWLTISLQSGCTANIDNTIITYGGYYRSYYYGMIEVYSDSVFISNSTISNSSNTLIYINGVSPAISNNTISDIVPSYGFSGIYIYNGSPTINSNIITNTCSGINIGSYLSSVPVVSNNNFSNNREPIMIYGILSDSNIFNNISDNIGSNNTFNAIIIEVATVANNMTLVNNNDLPYVIDYLEVESGYTLTIEPGTIIKFYYGYFDSNLTINGTLNAQGTATDPIVFTSIYDDTYGDDITGDGATISPGARDWDSITFSSGSTAIIDYAIIQYGSGDDHDDFGMLTIESDDINITNSTIANASYDVYINNASPNLTNNIISGATYTGIYIDSGLPVISNNTFTDNKYGLYINDDNITIDSNNFVSNTDGIYVNSSSSPTISNNTFTSNYNGINLNNGTPDISNNTFTNNTYPIYTSNSSFSGSFNVSNNTASSNTYNGIAIYIHCTNNITLSTDDNLPYVIGNLDVGSSGALTIEPGAILKFYRHSVDLDVDGTLNAQGTLAEPIIFTSLKDDTYGGDTNNDGSTTIPASGDWEYINFSSSSTAIIDNSVIRYGGHYHNYILNIASNNVSITNSSISDSAYDCIKITSANPTLSDNSIYNSKSGRYGIYIYGGSPNIDNNIIYNNSYGIYITSTATPTISNNDIYNNTSYGLYYSGTTTITTENNWWGDASGPYNATSNPTGIGDNVSNNVDFDPWLTTSIYYPTANAGADQAVMERDNVTLDGSGSTDPSGTGLTYSWAQTSGTNATLSDSTAVSPTFTAPSISADETLTFELTITNGSGETDSDSVDILVQADLTPPADATSFVSTIDVWQKRIFLSWTSPTDADFSGVRIDRSDGTTTTTLTTSYTRDRYTDTGLVYGTIYTYTIYSLDTDANQSAGVSTGKIIRNPAPRSLTLTAGDSQISANWTGSTAPASQIAGYRLYYRVRGTGSYTMIDAGNINNYTITGLANGTDYQVYVTVYSTLGAESVRSIVRIATPHL